MLHYLQYVSLLVCTIFQRKQARITNIVYGPLYKDNLHCMETLATECNREDKINTFLKYLGIKIWNQRGWLREHDEHLANMIGFFPYEGNCNTLRWQYDEVTFKLHFQFGQGNYKYIHLLLFIVYAISYWISDRYPTKTPFTSKEVCETFDLKRQNVIFYIFWTIFTEFFFTKYIVIITPNRPWTAVVFHTGPIHLCEVI